MIPRTTLRKALADPKLLGGILAGPSWAAWRTLLIAAMGEALNAEEREVFKKLTGRDHEPGQRVEELVGVIGRRGGKSRAISTLAVYLAGLCDHRKSLVPGERGVVLCIAPDQRQAHITLDYVAAAFQATPIMHCSASIWMGTQRQSGWPFRRSRREDDCRGPTITQGIFS